MTLREIGQRCKEFRRINGYTQAAIAIDTGYSVENVSSFENGRNDNCRLLMWYLCMGMKIEYLMGGCDND